MGDKDNILNDGTTPNDTQKVSLGAEGSQPNEDKLMAYLDGQLLPEEQHEIEQWLSEEGMESDAVEGLKMLETNDTRHTVNRLNQNLHKTLHAKKGKRREAKTDATTLIAVVIIILLITVAYLVIRMIK